MAGRSKKITPKPASPPAAPPALEQPPAADLLEELERRRVLFEQWPEGIVVIDPDTGRFLEFNTAAHRNLGYTREAFASLRIADVEALLSPEELLGHLAAAVRAGGAEFETRHRTRKGEIRNAHVTAKVVEVHGAPVFQASWRDDTVRRQVNALLEHSGAEPKYRIVE